jgi:hypothetical protein
MPTENEHRRLAKREMKYFCENSGCFEPFTSAINKKIESGLALLCETEEASVFRFDLARNFSLLSQTLGDEKLRAAS